MKASQDLRLRQSQRLVLSGVLKENLAILQYSAQELAAYVSQELLENPVLELEEESATSENWNLTENHAAAGVEETENGLVEEWVDYFCDASDLGYVPTERKTGLVDAFSFELPAQGPTLYEHLLSQLGLLRLTPQERLIGEYIIGNVGPDGYLKTSLEEMAFSLGTSLEEIEKMLKIIQSFDPPGVGARTLKECLLLQAGQRQQDALCRILITDYLEALAAGEISQVAKRLGVSVSEVLGALGKIRSLNPRPGSSFTTGPIPYVIPDLIVEKVNQDYVIMVNEKASPQLRLNQAYCELLKQGQIPEEARSFLTFKLRKAMQLIKAIEKRRTTLHRIGAALVELQQEFFDYGLSALKSMTLSDLAAVVGLHESTVSRAIANKYLQCPRGLFQLRSLLGSGVVTEGGQKLSAYSVKQLIKQLIGQEDKNSPLTDQEIAQQLTHRGITISRRTVTKYRAELGIPGAAERRCRA